MDRAANKSLLPAIVTSSSMSSFRSSTTSVPIETWSSTSSTISSFMLSTFERVLEVLLLALGGRFPGAGRFGRTVRNKEYFVKKNSM